MALPLFLTKFLFIFLIDGCIGIRTVEESSELLDVENVFSKEILEKNPFGALTEIQPVAVVVELKEPLLNIVKGLWERKNSTGFPKKKIVLATIGAKGLQDIFVYNESSKFLQTVQDLKPSVSDTEKLPTMHALNELLQKSNDIKDGSLILMTMTTPLDIDFADILSDSFAQKRSQLSVLWSGSNDTNDFTQLKNLVKGTNGRFEFTNNETGNDNSDYYRNDAENISGRVRFPEEQRSDDGATLNSRAADQKILQKASIPLIVEVASGTTLETRPGTPTQITFNVKNNLNVPVPAYFNAKFNGVVQNVQPPQAFLQPAANINVVVNLRPFSNAQTNAVGTLTLSAFAANKVISRFALIFLTPQTTTDKIEPKMDYKYEGDCSNFREPQNCENGHWGLTATIRDEDSGLLKILSEPYGLLFQSEFVAGTKSPVTVYYSATCCQPNVQIWAEDLRGNFVRKSFDVFNQTLLAGEIASIVVGVLLLILIMIGIIAAVILVKRRNRRNMIIPRVRSESR